MAEVQWERPGIDELLTLYLQAENALERSAERIEVAMRAARPYLTAQPTGDGDRIRRVARWANFARRDLEWRVDLVTDADGRLDATPPRSWWLSEIRTEELLNLLDEVLDGDQSTGVIELLDELAWRGKTSAHVPAEALTRIGQEGLADLVKSVPQPERQTDQEYLQSHPLRRALGRLCGAALTSDPPPWLEQLVNHDLDDDWLDPEQLLPLLADTPLDAAAGARLAAQHLRRLGAEAPSDLAGFEAFGLDALPDNAIFRGREVGLPFPDPLAFGGGLPDQHELAILALLDQPATAHAFLVGPDAPRLFSYFRGAEQDPRLAQVVYEGLTRWPAQNPGVAAAAYEAFHHTLVPELGTMPLGAATAERLAEVSVTNLPGLISHHLPEVFQPLAPAGTVGAAPAATAPFFRRLADHPRAESVLRAGIAVMSSALIGWTTTARQGEPDRTEASSTAVAVEAIVAMYDLLFEALDLADQEQNWDWLYFVLDRGISVGDRASAVVPWGTAVGSVAYLLAQEFVDDPERQAAVDAFTALTLADGSGASDSTVAGVSPIEVLVVNSILDTRTDLHPPVDLSVSARRRSVQPHGDPVEFARNYHLWKRTWPDDLRTEVALLTSELEQGLDLAARQ